MANDVKLNSFPSDRREALAMLFLKNQDLSGKSPEELAEMYDDAYEKISEKLDAIRKERKERNAKERSHHSILE